MLKIPTITCLLIALAAGAASGQKAERLTEDTYSTIRASILLGQAENAWEEIEWHPDFAEGLRVAQAEDKPVLLWIMNGHPCGMT